VNGNLINGNLIEGNTAFTSHASFFSHAIQLTFFETFLGKIC
jgi:hypothetical protein